jgi:hypothetical protein
MALKRLQTEVVPFPKPARIKVSSSSSGLKLHNFQRLAVCLKAYPDTNLSLSAACAELRTAWTAEGGCRYADGRGRPSYTSPPHARNDQLQPWPSVMLVSIPVLAVMIRL